MNRPEYVKCILLGEFNNGKPTNETWCGRKVDGWEFTFVDATHAALSGRNESRLVSCKGCADAINNALMNGREE